MGILISWLINTLAVLVVAYLLEGVHLYSIEAAFVTALILGVVNATLKPILLILTLPISIITLGLFTFVINALMVLLTSAIVPGFKVDSFWWALLFSLVLSLVSSFMHQLAKK